MSAVIAICIGACWQLGTWLNEALLPWGTLAANLIGGYLVGGCVAFFQAQPDFGWSLVFWARLQPSLVGNSDRWALGSIHKGLFYTRSPLKNIWASGCDFSSG
jgi:hypothetical protein